MAKERRQAGRQAKREQKGILRMKKGLNEGGRREGEEGIGEEGRNRRKEGGKGAESSFENS